MNSKILYLIAIVVIIHFVACNRSAKEITKVEAPKTGSAKKPIPAKVESYEVFYKTFHSDSVFQVSRIKFPMQGHFTDTVGDLHKWNANNWIMHKSEVSAVDTAIYKVELKNTKDFKTELLYIEGGGFKVERKFRRINGKWYLVFYTDENL